MLCASNLWHVFRVLQLPTDLVYRLQKCFVNCVWQGNHWTKGNLLSLPNEHGGIGLMHIDLSNSIF